MTIATQNCYIMVRMLLTRWDYWRALGFRLAGKLNGQFTY